MAQSVEEIAVRRSSNWHRRRDGTICTRSEQKKLMCINWNILL